MLHRLPTRFTCTQLELLSEFVLTAQLLSRAQTLLTCSDASHVLRRFSRAQTLLTYSDAAHVLNKRPHPLYDAQLALLSEFVLTAQLLSRAQTLLTCRRCSRAQTLLTCSTSVHTHYTSTQLPLLSEFTLTTRCSAALQVLHGCSDAAHVLNKSPRPLYTGAQLALLGEAVRCSSAPSALRQWSRTLLTCSTSDYPRCVGAQQLPPSVHLLPAVLACSTVAVQCAHTFGTLCSSAQRVLIEISRDLNGAQMLHKRPHSWNRCSPSPLDHLAAALVLRECCSTVTAIRGRASSRALS